MFILLKSFLEDEEVDVRNSYLKNQKQQPLKQSDIDGNHRRRGVCFCHKYQRLQFLQMKNYQAFFASFRTQRMTVKFRSCLYYSPYCSIYIYAPICQSILVTCLLINLWFCY